MKEEKNIKAEALLDAIGEIDDSFIKNAIEYKRPRRKINTHAVAIAASFAVVFCLAIGSLILPRLSGLLKDSEAADDVPNNGEQGEYDRPSYGLPSIEGDGGTLDSVFESVTETEKYEYVTDPEMLPYFDGARIVWQFSGSDRYYYSQRLDEHELERVKSSLGRSSASGEDSVSLNVRVWILLGDGRALSPHLALTRGNISAGIFDYEAEIVPDEDFSRLIRSILT